MAKLIKTVDSISFENSSGEYLDITYHIEGYVDINLETSGTFCIESENEASRTEYFVIPLQDKEIKMEYRYNERLYNGAYGN